MLMGGRADGFSGLGWQVVEKDLLIQEKEKLYAPLRSNRTAIVAAIDRRTVLRAHLAATWCLRTRLGVLRPIDIDCA